MHIQGRKSQQLLPFQTVFLMKEPCSARTVDGFEMPARAVLEHPLYLDTWVRATGLSEETGRPMCQSSISGAYILHARRLSQNWQNCPALTLGLLQDLSTEAQSQPDSSGINGTCHWFCGGVKRGTPQPCEEESVPLTRKESEFYSPGAPWNNQALSQGQLAVPLCVFTLRVQTEKRCIYWRGKQAHFSAQKPVWLVSWVLTGEGRKSLWETA